VECSKDQGFIQIEAALPELFDGVGHIDQSSFGRES
jgi:hypothetical protein